MAEFLNEAIGDSKNPEELFLKTEECFKLAKKNFGATEKFYRVLNHDLSFSTVGSVLTEAIHPLFSHLETVPSEDLSLMVSAWEYASSGVDLSWIPEKLSSNFKEKQGVFYGQLENTYEICLSVQGSGLAVSLLNLASMEAYYWINDAQKLPIYELRSPLRMIVNWWSRVRSLLFLHAGSVGTGNGAVLLGGRGGSGKSTTSVLSIAENLRYFGDDYVIVQNGNPPLVHSIYSSAKLDPAGFAYLPTDLATNLGPAVSRGEKDMYLLNSERLDLASDSCPIKAMVFPIIDSVSALEPIGAAEVVRRLAPSTMLQTVGNGSVNLANIFSLAKSIPAYSLKLDSNPRSAANLIKSLIVQ